MTAGSATPTVAEVYLAALQARGLRRLFVNAGTDFAPLVEAYARQQESGLLFPEVIVAAHENVAVSMAHGAFLAEGVPQAVMVHTSVGTANAICGVINASRARVPMLLTAGRSPLFEDTVPGSRNLGIHWVQEMYDQAGMLRELVKWDYELRGGRQVEAVLDRALDIASTAPAGPVYLSLPREVLAEPAGPGRPGGQRLAAPTEPNPDPAAVAALADKLLAARFPVFVTSSTGADKSTVALLGELCDRFAVAVLENGPRYVNVPAGHPMHAGYDLAAVLPDADVLCFLDLDVPWLPGSQAPAAGSFVVQCGPDPHFGQYPVRGHRSDLSISTGIGPLLRELSRALARREQPGLAARRDRIAEFARGTRARRAAASLDAAEAGGPITLPYLNWAFGQVCPPEAVVVNEYWVQPQALTRPEPGSYFGPPPAGGLGWGLPAALGFSLASPGRLVIATVGDGAYMFANPAACHQAMSRYRLPVLTVVANNERWTAVDRSAAAMYPGRREALASQPSPFADLRPNPAFEGYAEASGGYGVRVEQRGDLVPALRHALKVVTGEGRHALVNVICS
ncbi:MAG TPA: thiamine pyrophosphate-requiring protein [Trebonia sp.]|jgi:acetolactate synthase-1/2/3 large subunit|nr:thiamine pyrophosphate-requiring protein [Trebonia sp.]